MADELEIELLLSVKHRTTGRRYSMLERRYATTGHDDRYEIMLDMVERLIDRGVTPKMLEIERGDE